MSAQAFKIYNLAKKRIGAGLINLASGNFRMTLHSSASNAPTLTLGTYASLTGEVAEANGYSSSGKACTSRVWTVGASAKSYKFDVDDVQWVAGGGTIPNVKFAVIWLSAASALGRYPVCVASLTSAQFTIANLNSLTVTINTLGVFTMA
jgi:hypothetical protein